MPLDIHFKTINFVNRRGYDHEICLAGFGFLVRRFAVDQIFWQPRSRLFTDLRRSLANITATRKKLGREPLLLVQLALDMKRRPALYTDLEFILRMKEK